MATTTNFNWSTPDDTSLVKDGAAAIRTLGSSIDTTFVDLKGGTSGQLLTKASNTDMDFSWVTPSGGGMTLISTTTLSGSTVTISSIPQTFKNLYFVFRSLDTSSNGVAVRMRFNADTTASRHATQGFDATANAFTYNQNYSNINAGATYDATSSSQYVMTLWDYTNTVARKWGVTHFHDQNTSGTGEGNGGMNFIYYKQTTAVTSVEILVSSGTFTGEVLMYGVY